MCSRVEWYKFMARPKLNTVWNGGSIGGDLGVQRYPDLSFPIQVLKSSTNTPQVSTYLEPWVL